MDPGSSAAATDGPGPYNTIVMVLLLASYVFARTHCTRNIVCPLIRNIQSAFLLLVGYCFLRTKIVGPFELWPSSP